MLFADSDTRHKCLHGRPARSVTDLLWHILLFAQVEMACEEWLFAPYDLKYRHEQLRIQRPHTRTGRKLHHSDALNVRKKSKATSYSCSA